MSMLGQKPSQQDATVQNHVQEWFHVLYRPFRMWKARTQMPAAINKKLGVSNCISISANIDLDKTPRRGRETFTFKRKIPGQRFRIPQWRSTHTGSPFLHDGHLRWCREHSWDLRTVPPRSRPRRLKKHGQSFASLVECRK